METEAAEPKEKPLTMNDYYHLCHTKRAVLEQTDTKRIDVDLSNNIRIYQKAPDQDWNAIIVAKPTYMYSAPYSAIEMYNSLP